MTAPDRPLAQLTLVEARKAARRVRDAAGCDQTRPLLHVRLAGNANTDFAAELLALGLSQHGLRADVTSAGFDNWATEDFAEAMPDVWLLWLSTAGATRGGSYAPALQPQDVLRAVQRVRTAGSRVVVVLPELSPAERDPYGAVGTWRRRFGQELAGALEPLGVPALSLDHLVAEVGLTAWAATRYWETARLPCHPERLPAVVDELSATVAAMLLSRVRAIAVDLDDTLWGGLVGEVGPEGLELDPFGSGRAYLELQSLLKEAKDKGVPLCVVSKNDPEVAIRPFTERHEMVLKREDLAGFEAGWDAKHLAIAAFARQVNVGIDTICFLDDSPFERDQAAAHLPGLIVPDLPGNPAERVPALLRDRLLLRPVVTEEDRLRAAFVARAEQPDAEAPGGEYLAGLKMVLRPRRLVPDGLDRTVELFGKTNQFNLTLSRTPRSTLAPLVDDPETYAYKFSLEDRLGPAGDIAAVVAVPAENGLLVREWVMSCRVFSRGVEWAVLQHLLDWARARGHASLVLPYVVGPRNTMVRQLLAGLEWPDRQDRDDGTTFTGMPSGLPGHTLTIEEDT